MTDGIETFARLLLAPRAVCEVRALGSPRGVCSGYFDDVEKLVKAIRSAKTQRASGVYVTLNPVQPDLLARRANRLVVLRRGDATTADADVIARHWLLIDLDPERPSGISSTNAEHELALHRAGHIRESLGQEGWPEPVMIDSGNGAHLLYRVDLPNDDKTTDLVKRVLQSLDLRFDGQGVQIDTSVYNACRITKVPGTTARKGDNIPERPHRKADLIAAPSQPQVVACERLEALAARVPKPPVTRSTSRRARPDVTDPLAILDAIGVEYDEGRPWNDAILWRLDRCPFSQAHQDGAYVIKFSSGAIAAGCHHSSCEGKRWADLLAAYPEAAQSASTYAAPFASASVDSPDDGIPLPPIIVNQRQLRDVTADAINALVQANDPPITFFRGTTLSRVVTADTDLPRIETIDPRSARQLLAGVADWFQLRMRDGAPELIDTFVPMDVAANLLVTPNLPLPPLNAIAETPVFAPDGSLIAEPGYHAGLRLWLHLPPNLTLRLVPAKPSAAKIAEAKALILDELFGDFPFVDEASRADAVALFLLPVVRCLINGPTPLHLIDAPTAGTGKSLLIESMASSIGGRPPAVMTEKASASGRSDEAEWRKAITAALLEAPTFVLIDNVRHGLDSAQLASALTAHEWSDRLLGVSQIVRLPVTAGWVATGNNVRISTELARRTVPIRLDARIDQPWLRDGFRHPLPGWAIEHRADLLWAALTLVQAWIAVGRPPDETIRPLGSFEAWSTVMGGILKTAGIPGFLTNLSRLYEQSDEEGASWREFVRAWADRYGAAPVATRNLHTLAINQDLLGSVLGDGGERSQKTKLGRALGQRRDQMIGGFRLLSGEDDRSGRATWVLEPVDGQTSQQVCMTSARTSAGENNFHEPLSRHRADVAYVVDDSLHPGAPTPSIDRSCRSTCSDGAVSEGQTDSNVCTSSTSAKMPKTPSEKASSSMHTSRIRARTSAPEPDREEFDL